LFFYPAGVELIKFYAEKESFDILYSYKILLRHPEGQKILGNYLRRAVKQDPERIFNAFSNKNEFLEDPWVRAWFFEHAVELDLFSFSLMLNKTKDWQDNENIIKKIVAKSSPKSVLTFAQHLYAMDRVWAVSILPEVFSSATEHDKSFYIYTLIGLKEPALKNVLMEYAKKLPKSNILFYWQYFKLLDQEWARGLVLELLPTLSIQGILQNFRTICEVDAEFGKKLVAEKLAGNFGLAIESYYQYRAELPNSTDIFLKAIKIASELNPGLVVENGKKLQELPGGEKFLLAALEKLVVSDPRIVFVNFKEWADLSIESVRPLIRIATINDPGWALMVLSQSGDLANLLRSILATDQDPNIEKLLAWDKEATVTADKQIGAILLFNGKNSLAEIKEIVGDKDLLFLSLVEIMSSGNAAARASADRELAGLALRQVREVNDLHERPDTERFKLANKLNASELYTLIVYGEEEEFTSTYNGFFNRLLEKMKAEQLTPKSLLAATGYNKFRVFIKLATQFNRLGEFLALMDSASQQELLSKFAGDIEKSPDFLAEAVSVADTFSVIEDAESLKTLQAKVKQEYERVLAQGHREGVAIYGLLAGMFSEKAVIDEEWIKAMAEKYHLTNIAELPIEDLVRDKKIVQQYCFFNDADGKASYQNFLAGYRGQEKWKITEYQDYVVISSVGTAKQVEIYANKPESYVSVVNEALQKANLQPTVLVHRGHSYHAQSSVNLVTEHTRLVSLGSCGGYNLIDPVLEKSKTAHIISTKGTGAMSVNDPLLKLLNEELAGGHNLNWSNFWAKAEKLLGGNKYFGDYVPPNKNLGVLFLKAYREHLEKDVYDADVN